MAFSSDSTCVRHLYSAQDGYETLHLEKIQDQEEKVETTCVFPDWLQGKWESLTIEGSKFTYRDEHNFVTYTGTCMDFVNSDEFIRLEEAGENGKSDLKFLLKLNTECGASSFNCAQFQRRDSNVMEFQLGKGVIKLVLLTQRGCQKSLRVAALERKGNTCTCVTPVARDSASKIHTHTTASCCFPEKKE